MLKCRDVAQQAGAFIDGEVPWHRRPAWVLHLLICHHCRRFVRHLRTTVRVAGRASRQPASNTQIEQIVAACEHQKHPPD